MPRPPAPASQLPEPVARLSSDQLAVRRSVDRDFGGDTDAASRAAGVDGEALEAHLIGREEVPAEVMERLADALGYSVDQLRAPHPEALWNPDLGWVTPGEPHYDEVRSLVSSARPASSAEEDDDL